MTGQFVISLVMLPSLGSQEILTFCMVALVLSLGLSLDSPGGVPNLFLAASLTEARQFSFMFDLICVHFCL